MIIGQTLLNTTVKKLTAHPFKYGRYRFLKFYRPYWKTLYILLKKQKLKEHC